MKPRDIDFANQLLHEKNLNVGKAIVNGVREAAFV